MLNINNYYDKYIKYKLKYLKLIKNNTIIIGGAPRQLTVNSKDGLIDVLDIEDTMTMYELIKQIKRRVNNKFIKLVVNGQVIYRPCKPYDLGVQFPTIFDYYKNNGLWVYNSNTDEYSKSISQFFEENQVILGNTSTITVKNGVSDIFNMYLEYMSSLNSYFPVEDYRSTIGLFQFIQFPIKITDSDILSELQCFELIMKTIEAQTSIEDKIYDYDLIVAFLLDPDNAVEAIKQIIMKCPFAFKGYPGNNPSIIETFFKSLYTNEQYLNPFFIGTINYYQNELLSRIYRNRIVPTIVPRFEPVMIPENCLNNKEVIDFIIEKIATTADVNVKRVRVIILVYACAPDSIMYLIEKLSNTIKKHTDLPLIDSATLIEYKKQPLQLMLDPKLLLPPLPPPPPPPRIPEMARSR